MNSWYDGFVVESGASIVSVSGGGFSAVADIDDIGKCHDFTLLIDNTVVMSLSAEQFSNLNKVMSLVSGEQLRRTVVHVRSEKEGAV